MDKAFALIDGSVSGYSALEKSRGVSFATETARTVTEPFSATGAAGPFSKSARRGAPPVIMSLGLEKGSTRPDTLVRGLAAISQSARGQECPRHTEISHTKFPVLRLLGAGFGYGFGFGQESADEAAHGFQFAEVFRAEVRSGESEGGGFAGDLNDSQDGSAGTEDGGGH